MKKVQYTRISYGLMEESVSLPIMIVFSFSYACKVVKINAMYF